MSKERSVEQVCQTNVRVTGPELKRWREEGWSGVVVVGHFVESDRALHTSHESDQSERTLQDWSFPWWHVPWLVE